MACPGGIRACPAFGAGSFGADTGAAWIMGRQITQNEDASAYWTYSAEHNGGYFLVRVDQYPAGIPVPAPNQRIDELLLGAHAKESSSRLVSIQSSPLGAFPAVQGVFASQAGVTEKRRVVMAGHRLYQISCTHAERGRGFRDGRRLPGLIQDSRPLTIHQASYKPDLLGTPPCAAFRDAEWTQGRG